MSEGYADALPLRPRPGEPTAGRGRAQLPPAAVSATSLAALGLVGGRRRAMIERDQAFQHA